MHKDKAFECLQKNLSAEEELVGYFMATKPFKIWLFFVIGPLAALSMKSYVLAVTDKGMHFHALNMLGKFSQHDFFEYSEIDGVDIGDGTMQIPMKYTFSNGRILKLKAQRKGLNRVAKINDNTLMFIKENVGRYNL